MNAYRFSEFRLGELRRAVKRADLVIFEDLIRFLQDDPIAFGTGYTKEVIWKYIGRYDLSKDHIQRLEEAAFTYLARPMTPEFKFMCLTMSHIATEAFWKRVEAVLRVDNPIIQINAYCLYAYSTGIHAGEKQRLQMKKVKFQLFVRYHAYYSVYSVEELLALIKAPENWPEGVICYRQPHPTDIPVLNYHLNDVESFTSLDVSKSNKEVVLKNLNAVLFAGVLHPEIVNTWNYAIYLLEQLDYPEAVGSLIDFMDQKLDFARNTYYRKLLAQMVQRALKYYGTAEAFVAIKKLETITKHHCNIGILEQKDTVNKPA